MAKNIVFFRKGILKTTRRRIGFADDDNHEDEAGEQDLGEPKNKSNKQI